MWIYAERFPHRNIPDSRTFTAIHSRLRETGSVRPRQRDPQRGNGQPREHEILEYNDQHPTASCRSVALALGINNHWRVWRVLNAHQMHPFCYPRVQGLNPADYPQRVQFSRGMINHLREDRNFSSYILFSDEAHFTREGIFNHQNQHEWRKQSSPYKRK